MKILIFGKNGQLGWELQRTTACLGQILFFDYPEIDLVHPEQACDLIREIKPELVINATAYTQVDRAESEPDIAMAINGTAPGRLAKTAAEIQSAFIHFSTDYVFDGKKGSAYTEKDAPNPLNLYGESKLAGEKAVEQACEAALILRTSWLYSTRRDSFVTKVLKWGREQSSLRIVADQIGSPTWARMLAEVTTSLIARFGFDLFEAIAGKRGIYHLGGSGCASRYEWAKAILHYDPHPEIQKVEEVQPASTAEFPTPAIRPANTCLDCRLFSQQFDLQLPDWETSLKLAMAEQ